MRLFAVLAFMIGVASAAYCPFSSPDVVPESTGGLAKTGGTGFSTYFDGFGIPYGGCGVPQSWLVDAAGKELPFVALNTQLSSFSVPSHEEPIPSSILGVFDNGRSCGRWMKITLKQTCKRGSNTNERICIVGNTDGVQNYEADADTGKVIYGYVADKCADFNVWCRLDKYHVDISSASIAQYVPTWGNRLVTWHFLDSHPPGFHFSSDISFGWATDAYLPYYASVIIYNVNNGISRVSVRSKLGSMIPARANGVLGQMWVLPWDADTTGSKDVIEAFDVSAASYGQWSVLFPCGQKCTEPTKAEAQRL